MKLNYYRKLLKWDWGLTPTELLLYDFLLTKSIAINSDVYDKDGSRINMDALLEYLKYSNNQLDVYKISFRKLAAELGVSLASIYNSIKRLKGLRIIGDEWIYCHPSIPKGGYFEIRTDLLEEINGKLLVFYSWLCDKAKDGMLEIKRDTMAKYFGEPQDVGKRNIHNMMQRLYEHGYIRRETISTGEYGKIQLLK